MIIGDDLMMSELMVYMKWFKESLYHILEDNEQKSDNYSMRYNICSYSSKMDGWIDKVLNEHFTIFVA